MVFFGTPYHPFSTPSKMHPQVGLGSAFRLNALAHVADPLIRRDVEVQQLAMEVALRFQHLAAGWLIYAYNGNLPSKIIGKGYAQ